VYSGSKVLYIMDPEKYWFDNWKLNVVAQDSDLWIHKSTDDAEASLEPWCSPTHVRTGPSRR
jgi:hypothetical protein